jgi:peptide deformylase
VPDEEILTPAFYFMAETLRATALHYECVGLAANQIGWDASVFVLKHPDGIAIFINPEILLRHGDVVGIEGCLSFPGVTENLRAPTFVDVSFKTIDGDDGRIRLGHSEKVDDAVGKLLARAAFHETEHLAGRTWLDRCGDLQRKLLLKRYYKAKFAKTRSS